MTFDDFAEWVTTRSGLPPQPSSNLAGLVLTDGTMMRAAFLLGMRWRDEFDDLPDWSASQLNDMNELEH